MLEIECMRFMETSLREIPGRSPRA